MTTEDIFESFSNNLKDYFEKILKLLNEIDIPDEDQFKEIEKFLHSLKGNSVAFNFNMEFINKDGQRLVEYIRSNKKIEIKYLRNEINNLYKEFCKKTK